MLRKGRRERSTKNGASMRRASTAKIRPKIHIGMCFLLPFALPAACGACCYHCVIYMPFNSPSNECPMIPNVQSFIRSCRQVSVQSQQKAKLTCLGWPMRLPWISRRGGCRSPGRTDCRRRRGRLTGATSGGCPGTARPCACCGGVRPCFVEK